MHESLRDLYLDLLAWQFDVEFAPLIERAKTLFGPRIVDELPADAQLARSELIDRIEARQL